jgi:hypothetical protein
MNHFRRNRIAPTLVSLAVSLLLWLPSNRAKAQDDLAATAAKSKISFPTKVVDSKGKTVGTYQPINETFGPYGILDTALIVINGTAHQLPVGQSGFGSNCGNIGVFFFSGSNCTGTASVEVQNGSENSAPLVLDEVSGASGCVQNNQIYYAQAPFSSISYVSWGYGSDPEHVSCNAGGGTTWGGAVATFDLSKLNLKPPFKLK